MPTSGNSLGRKLTLSFLAIGALVLALSYSSLNAIGTLGGLLDEAANVAARKMDLVGEISAGFQEMEDHAKKTQLSHAFRSLEHAKKHSAAACSGCHTVDAQDEDQRLFEAAGGKVKQRIAEARPLIADARGLAALDVVENGVTQWTRLYREYLAKASANDFDAAHEIITGQMLPLMAGIDESTRLLADQQRAYFADSNRRARETTSRNRWAAVFLIALSMLVITGVTLTMRRTSIKLRQLASDLGQKAVQVFGAAERVSASSQTLAQGATDQAGSLQEVSASTGDIRSTAHKNVDNAKTSAEVSTQVSHSLAEANGRLEQLMSAMGDIQAASGKVAKIIKVIRSFERGWGNQVCTSNPHGLLELQSCCCPSRFFPARLQVLFASRPSF